jgi:hypothetical protein
MATGLRHTFADLMGPLSCIGSENSILKHWSRFTAPMGSLGASGRFPLGFLELARMHPAAREQREHSPPRADRPSWGPLVMRWAPASCRRGQAP